MQVMNQEANSVFLGGLEHVVTVRASAPEPVDAIVNAVRVLLEKLIQCRELDFKFGSTSGAPAHPPPTPSHHHLYL